MVTPSNVSTVGRCTSHRVYLDRGLDAVPYIGTDRDCRRMACHDDLSLGLYGLVIFDVGWQHYSDATYGVLQDAIGRRLSYSLQFRPPQSEFGRLIQCPLKDIWFICSFQEILESVGVRDQASSSRYLPQQLQEL